MEFRLTKFTKDSNWINGTIGDYTFNAKHFDNSSIHGINNGRVSKLVVKNNISEIIINFDRGWDIQPKTEEEKLVFNELLQHLEKLPMRGLENNYHVEEKVEDDYRSKVKEKGTDKTIGSYNSKDFAR